MRQCREKLTLLDTTFFCCLPEEHQCAHGYRFLQSDVERFAARAERAETDLAAARDEAKISEDALQSACVKALNERDQLRQNLAAARALLRDCRSLVRCESLDHYRKADQHDGFGPCPIEMRMKDAIDAALAGEKK